MFYLLTHDGSISMCRYHEGWVYAWHFTNRNVVGGGRVNPRLVTLKLLDGTWDVRKNVDLKIPDQEELVKEFNAWCDRWFTDDPRSPSSPSLIGEVPAGKHEVPGGNIYKKHMW